MNISELLPMSPLKGPPLPEILGIRWPWVQASAVTTLKGTVKDSTGKAISGANVRITDFSVPPSGTYSIDKSTTTDSQGNYSFSSIDLSTIYTPSGWVGNGRGIKIDTIAFGHGLNEQSLIINPGDNTLNLIMVVDIGYNIGSFLPIYTLYGPVSNQNVPISQLSGDSIRLSVYANPDPSAATTKEPNADVNGWVLVDSYELGQ